jgi:predicted O-methyltransferase YrrM
MLQKLQPLQEESQKRGIPIIGPEKGAWLLEKVKEVEPRKILELGTANGYSGCILGSERAELTTIEQDPWIAEDARKNFSKFEISAKIIIGDAVEAVQGLVNENIQFDLIFIDFAKKKYIEVLENCINLVKQNGLIIADNITMNGCQDYKEAILKDERLETEIINIKDGLSCSRKK